MAKQSLKLYLLFFAGLACVLFLLFAPIFGRRSQQTGKTSPGISIVSLSPAVTAILDDLGMGPALTGIDNWSPLPAGTPSGTPRFDMLNPDIEGLAALEPDLLIVTTMSRQGSNQDPFEPLAAGGIRVIYTETSTTLDDIRADIRLLAQLTDRTETGELLIADMDTQIAAIASLSETIPAEKRRSVVFEIAAAPYIYSFGTGVYLNELLEIAGARNILDDQNGWIAVSAETIVQRSPDVILTNVNWLDDPVTEIMNRPAWKNLPAVKNGRVFLIDSNSSSQPTHRITRALFEIAHAVYPELF